MQHDLAPEIDCEINELLNPVCTNRNCVKSDDFTIRPARFNEHRWPYLERCSSITITDNRVVVPREWTSVELRTSFNKNLNFSLHRIKPDEGRCRVIRYVFNLKYSTIT